MQVFHHKKICAICEIFDPFEQKKAWRRVARLSALALILASHDNRAILVERK
jgi:hypothetical protein